MASALPVRLLPAAAQEQVEPPAGLPVGADVLVDPLPARHRDALLAEAAGDLLRAPALRKPVLHRAPPLPGHLPGNGRGGAAPRRGLALRLPVPVAAAAAVAPDLAPDRRPVPADLPGNGQVGQPAFPQRVYLASFAIGQVVVAARHDSLHASTQGLSPPSGRFATSCAEGRRSPPLLVLHFRVARGDLLNRINRIRGSGLSRSAYKRRIRPDPPSHGCDVLQQIERALLAGIGPGRHLDLGLRPVACARNPVRRAHDGRQAVEKRPEAVGAAAVRQGVGMNLGQCRLRAPGGQDRIPVSSGSVSVWHRGAHAFRMCHSTR